jgi:tRNA (mo5U34)-methyltransferase
MVAEFKRFWEELNDVKKRAIALSSRFSQAAQKLQADGTPLAETLMEELADYHQDFDRLRAKVQEFAAPQVAQLSVTSLEDLERLLLKTEVAKIPAWHHSIDLGCGVITPGGGQTFSPRSEQRIGLPENLAGMTVLDVGAWDGFYSFASEKRGAKRVLATDSFVWQSPMFGKGGFELARTVLNSQVEDMEIDVLELSPEKVGVFDLVLFLGVLYHMRHPLLALDRVFSVTGKQLILETHVDMLDCQRPALAFYPRAELNNDPTNWFGPNALAVQGMLESAGFRDIKIVSTAQLSSTSARMVFHAWR